MVNNLKPGNAGKSCGYNCMVIGHIPVQEMMQSRIDTSPIPVIIVR
jgi:hypothetical protein